MDCCFVILKCVHYDANFFHSCIYYDIEIKYALRPEKFLCKIILSFSVINQ